MIDETFWNQPTNPLYTFSYSILSGSVSKASSAYLPQVAAESLPLTQIGWQPEQSRTQCPQDATQSRSSCCPSVSQPLRVSPLPSNS